MSEMDNRDLVEMTDEDGNVFQMEVIDYFFYNGEEYVILGDTDGTLAEEGDDPEQVNCCIMRVEASEDEEDMESFVPIEDEKLERRLIEVAMTQLNEDDEEE